MPELVAPLSVSTEDRAAEDAAIVAGELPNRVWRLIVQDALAAVASSLADRKDVPLREVVAAAAAAGFDHAVDRYLRPIKARRAADCTAATAARSAKREALAAQALDLFKKGFSQREIAKITRKSERTVARWLDGVD